MTDSNLASLASVDPDIARLVAEETAYQRDQVRLIASENYASSAVIAATGTVFMNKYAEGYPHKRYYEGQLYIDQVEELGGRHRVIPKRFRMRQAIFAEWPGKFAERSAHRMR